MFKPEKTCHTCSSIRKFRSQQEKWHVCIYYLNKLRVVNVSKFKIQTPDLCFTCGASMEEVVGNEPAFDSLFIHYNLTFLKLIKAIYYSAANLL